MKRWIHASDEVTKSSGYTVDDMLALGMGKEVSSTLCDNKIAEAILDADMTGILATFATQIIAGDKLKLKGDIVSPVVPGMLPPDVEVRFFYGASESRDRHFVRGDESIYDIAADLAHSVQRWLVNRYKQRQYDKTIEKQEQQKLQQSESTIKSTADIVAFLNSKGIDTTKHRYKLKYNFDRERNEITFTCPGDYLALFATRLANAPSYNRMVDWYGSDLKYFTKIVNDNPTYEDLYNYGDSHEWFDREEYGGITLINLDTGDVLVESIDYRDPEYDIDWED